MVRGGRRKRGLTPYDVSKHFIPVFHQDFPFFPQLPAPLPATLPDPLPGF